MVFDKNFEELASAYFRTAEGSGERDAWAYVFVNELITTDSNAAWLLILKLLELAPDKSTLSYIGAGPLENLIRYQGKIADVIDEIEQGNERLLYAALSVWLDKNSKEENRLRDVFEEFEVHEKEPLPELP